MFKEWESKTSKMVVKMQREGRAVISTSFVSSEMVSEELSSFGRKCFALTQELVQHWEGQTGTKAGNCCVQQHIGRDPTLSLYLTAIFPLWG